MQHRIDSREFTGWQAYTALYGPIGPEREDQRAALIAMHIANANRDIKKHPAPFKLEDFMLYRPDRAEAEQSEEEKALALERKIVSAFGRWIKAD